MVHRSYDLVDTTVALTSFEAPIAMMFGRETPEFLGGSWPLATIITEK